TYAAQAAGVRAPGLVGVAEAEDSMLLVQEHTGGAVPLDEVGDDVELGDDVLREIWAQVRLAHEVGLAHRALTSQTVLVELPGEDDTTGPVVWLTGWDQGDIASSDLARRMDLTQMVALLAVRVGPERALASAAAVLPADDIAAIGPLLQPVVLPGRTRQEMREHREVLAGLRAALVERLPEADVEPERVARFGTRTLLTVVVPLVAVVVLLARINLDQIAAALEQSDWRWALAAFGFGLLTFVGAALAFTAFSPLKIPLRTAILVQTASAFVALAAPSGLGPAALNLRMLTRRGVSTALAVATVALVQVSQFVVTVALLVVLSVASGTNDAEQFAPRAGVLVAVGAVAALVAGALLVPVVRQWVLGKTLPVLRQTWPRLIEVVGEPRRVLLAVGGDLLMAVSWILAFDASLAAFGQHLSLVQAALVYFLGNAAGSAIPVPGGIGTIEFALIAGLSAAGINAGVAASAVFLFRAVTYWLQIPIGWAALHRLQRTGRL
ncbi:MAG: TIGR00374 family protein, partial [Cellulomonadaceae bacterium]|nr:TIGR00374 family protein [Cellulomonadaceae bacterium]